MDWIQQWQSKLNKQNEVAPLVRTGGSRHTGLAALPYRNIHQNKKTCFHLCKAPFGARPVLGAPGGYNHSVPSSSLSWPPLRFSFVTMITWFSY